MSPTMSSARAMKPKKVEWTYRITDKELELTEYYGSIPYTKDVSTLNLETGASELGERAKSFLESAVPDGEAPDDVASNVTDLAPVYFLKRAVSSGEELVQGELKRHGYDFEFVDNSDGYRAAASDLEVHVSLPAGWRGEETGN